MRDFVFIFRYILSSFSSSLFYIKLKCSIAFVIAIEIFHILFVEIYWHLRLFVGVHVQEDKNVMHSSVDGIASTSHLCILKGAKIPSGTSSERVNSHPPHTSNCAS